MGNKHRSLAKLAIAGGLAATLLAPGVLVAQSKPRANGSDSAIQQVVVNGPEQDPNMPLLSNAIPGAGIAWSPGSGTTPQVKFFKNGATGRYLGFNDKGSWIRNEGDRKIYVWNLKYLSLTVGAENDAEVPINLRNPSDDMKDLIANATGHGTSSKTVVANNNKGRNTPYIPPGVAGDGNAQHVDGEAPDTAHPAGASRQIRGTGATIKAGVLTFILDDPASPDNGRPVSLKVTRSMNNPAKANGIAGAWFGEDPKNTNVVMSLYVQGENGAVSGTAMTGLAAETLKRIMNARQ